MRQMNLRGGYYASVWMVALMMTGGFSLAKAAPDNGRNGQGSGQIDTEQYNCNGLAATECILAKLDRIERRVGCPLEDYLDDTCPYSPVDTTATFCISQGREGGIDVEWGATYDTELELGLGWDIVGKIEAKYNASLPPLFSLLPTELNVTGTGFVGRIFDICMEVPLEAFAETVGLETFSDKELLDRIVRNINSPLLGSNKSKFQRRLGRLANYAIFRVPGARRVGDSGNPATSRAYDTALAIEMDDDGESEFDVIDDAIERIMSGDFGIPQDGGPLALLESEAIQDLRSVIEIPKPAQDVLENPNAALAGLLDLGSGLTAGGTAAGASSICDRLRLTPLRVDSPGIDQLCGAIDGLPSFENATGVITTVGEVKDRVDSLPTLAQIRNKICDLLPDAICDD